MSRRHLRSNNSWMHNVKVLVKGKPRCTLLVHPVDAARSGLADGDVATVRSEAGTIEVPVEVTDGIRAGVVSLPHGWGHDKEGTRLSVAREHAGVNSNVLAPGTFVDEISGNAAVNGIPVTVTAASPEDPTRFCVGILPGRRFHAETGVGLGDDALGEAADAQPAEQDDEADQDRVDGEQRHVRHRGERGPEALAQVHERVDQHGDLQPADRLERPATSSRCSRGT